MTAPYVCLWANNNIEEMAAFYTGLFPNSRIVNVVRSPTDGHLPAETPLVIDMELDGRPVQILNGGIDMPYTEAISLVIDCADQAEIDYYWEALSANGGAEIECGWVKDRFGVRWQVASQELVRLFGNPDRAAAARAFQAMMTMKKLDIAKIEAAAAGG
jgi:predicted 3-demethylubiquinone-9 3-methyltransferase (glyoxalase superfamily)